MHHAGRGILIDPTARVDPDARLGRNVRIGAYAVVGPDVELGDDCEVGPHATVYGPTRMGAGNRIFQFASVGAEPQDKKYAGEETRLEIGDGNTIREFVTINRGTVQDKGVTRIGNGNWIMAYVHIAHDCTVADGVVFANGASLAGHVEVGEQAILGGFTLVHQFCRIGAYCFSSMGSCIKQDVPPYVTVSGNPATPHGINSEGLRRQGFARADILALRRAYRLVYKSSLRLEPALEKVDALARDHAPVERLAAFIRGSDRGIVR